MSHPPGHGRGDRGVSPTFKGSEEQHGGPAHPPSHTGMGTDGTSSPSTYIPRAGCPQAWLSPSPWPCLRIPPVSPPHVYPKPAVAERCPQLRQLRRAPGRPPGTPSPRQAPLQPSATPSPGSNVPLSPQLPAEMPAGQEGKLRHEVGRSTVTQEAGTSANRRLHRLIYSFLSDSPPPLQELPCLSPGPSQPGFPPPAGPLPRLFREVPARLFPSQWGAGGSGSPFEAPRRALTLRASRGDAGREPTLPSRTLFPRSRTGRDESPSSSSSSSSPPASSQGKHRPGRAAGPPCPSPPAQRKVRRRGGRRMCTAERGELLARR